MLGNKISRRQMLKSSGFALAGSLFSTVIGCSSGERTEKEKLPVKRPFRIGMNVSTISAYSLSVPEQIELCSEAGFDGVELWIRDVDAFVKQGGKHDELRGLLDQTGVFLENMISFSTWCADDPRKREEGLRQIRHDMEIVSSLGGHYIAAPVQGVNKFDYACLPDYMNRYRTILDLGDEYGVTPILELWGAGPVCRLADAVAIAIGTSHPKASLLLDFYHLFRGGNSFDGLRLVGGDSLPIFHINDYPASPPRENLKDSDRVFPGDGICPFDQALSFLYTTGFRGCLSVELFNKNYWATMDVKTLLKVSYEKTTQVIDHFLEERSLL